MIIYDFEDDCVGCETCTGFCPRNQKYIVVDSMQCDKCKEEVETLYVMDDEEQWCADCVLSDYETITEERAIEMYEEEEY